MVPSATGVRWASLDGIRAVGVLLVFAYHADYTPHGFGRLGVDLFFPLSGFLITTIILDEYNRSQDFEFRRFYWRRLLRLYPALAATTLGAFLVRGVIVHDGNLRAFASTAFYALSYTMNLAVAFTGRDVTIGLTPTWTLALEEQFYLVWPVLLVLILRRGGGVRSCALMAGALTAGSWVLLFRANSYRDYFRPDARAGGLMIGCLLAILVYRRPLSQKAARALLLGGACCLIGGVLAMSTEVSRSESLAIAITSFGGALLPPALISLPNSRLGAVLASRTMVWLGRRSYGIYLIHLPVILELRGHIHSRPLVLTLGLIVTCVLSALMYRLVEQPALRVRDRRRAGALGNA